MLIHFLKFIHILITVSLLGAVIFCVILISSKKFTLRDFYCNNNVTGINKIILWLSVLTILTGTFLVYPKHFTFHTPWIQAAYILILVFSSAIGSLLWIRKKKQLAALLPQFQRWLWLFVYGLLTLILVGIIHDAVTKTTFLLPMLSKI
jgi:hypothetical protein